MPVSAPPLNGAAVKMRVAELVQLPQEFRLLLSPPL
jgi:hypothetical protein